MYGQSHIKERTIKEVDNEDGMIWIKCSQYWKVKVAPKIVHKDLLLLLMEMQARLLEMKLKSAKVPKDHLMFSIMTTWKTLGEEIHWRQQSSPIKLLQC